MSRKAFSDLPIEVRVMIYKYAFADHTVRIHSETCTRSDAEARELLPNGERHLHDQSESHNPTSEREACNGRDHNQDVNSVSQSQHKTSSEAPLKSVLHLDLFLLSKAIKEEATSVFWNLTTFELHAECINEVPPVLSRFTQRDPSWEVRNLYAPDGDNVSSKLTWFT